LVLWRNFGETDLNWVQFFMLSAYATSIVGVALTALAASYFWRHAPVSHSEIALSSPLAGRVAS